jgi:hypothetical protein
MVDYKFLGCYSVFGCYRLGILQPIFFIFRILGLWIAAFSILILFCFNQKLVYTYILYATSTHWCIDHTYIYNLVYTIYLITWRSSSFMDACIGSYIFPQWYSLLGDKEKSRYFLLNCSCVFRHWELFPQFFCILRRSICELCVYIWNHHKQIYDWNSIYEWNSNEIKLLALFMYFKCHVIMKVMSMGGHVNVLATDEST